MKDEDWLVVPASNGFIIDEIAFKWLQYIFNIIQSQRILMNGGYCS
jgi:hypothetical protein